MKNSAVYERRFKALLAQLRKAYRLGELQLPTDPTSEFVWSVLVENANEGTAKVALSRLGAHFVDHNELRVSRADEIAEILPNTLPGGAERGRLLIAGLQAFFDRTNALDISSLREQPKRDVRNFLAAIPHMTPFVEGRVCLLALGIHAMPVDRLTVELLVERGALHAETDPRDTQGFLERVVPAKNAVEVALLLEALRQEPGKVPAPARRSSRRPAAARRTAKKARPRPSAARAKKKGRS